MRKEKCENIREKLAKRKEFKKYSFLSSLFLFHCARNPTKPTTGHLTSTVFNVGFPISQASEFDHRLGEVVAESKTNSDDLSNIKIKLI